MTDYPDVDIDNIRADGRTRPDARGTLEENMMTRMTDIVTRLWRSDRPLTAAGLLMLLAGVAALAALAIDPRVIGGAPAWMKPAKFAFSTAIYCLTLAWTFTYLRDWPRVRRIAGVGTAAIIVMEVAIISLQAARGVTSHFNVSTPLNAVLFGLMGSGILLQTGLSAAVAAALWRQPFADAGLGWALRLGLSITIAGALTGGLMTRPTAAQLEAARAGAAMTVAGAHTVGAPDGGPGIPVTGWSTKHGDLRVPHFLGLHAFQMLPLVAVAVRWRRRGEAERIRLVGTATASYLGLFAILLWQALRGQSILQPDAVLVAAISLWVIASAVAATWSTARRGPVPAAHALIS
jgi:hypothetical protein